MNNRIIAIIVTLCFALPIVKAQSVWTSAEINLKVLKGLNAFAEGEYRTHDGMSSTERWAGTVGVDYKLLNYLKITAGYTYIHQHTMTEITKKGNIIPAYWQPKHRASFALTRNYSWKKLSFSLRERYQYTYRTEQSVPKFDSDGISPKEDELIEAKHKHVLRSRLEIEYNIAKRCRFMPYASAEIYNLISDGWIREKIRWTIGSSIKIDKKNSIDLYYRYIDADNEDEEGGHIIGLGYKFKL